jgi:hypothetical protein
MRKIYILILFSCFISSYDILKQKKNASNFTVAYLEDIYIDKRGKQINNFIGIFPKTR